MENKKAYIKLRKEAQAKFTELYKRVEAKKIISLGDIGDMKDLINTLSKINEWNH